MDALFDPNMPDTTNGDFFCSLCLASMNSENMWSAHIVGKRHIKNAATYPNGLPKKRKFFDDEDSYQRPPKMDRSRAIDDYLPNNQRNDYFYDEEYYDSRPLPYVPEVRPNVVFDYGHQKINDVTKPADSSKHPVISKERETTNLDEILKEVSKSEGKRKAIDLEPVKDDFFQKINERELAREVAQDLAKSIFLEKIPSITKDKDPSVPGTAELARKDIAQDLAKSLFLEKMENITEGKNPSVSGTAELTRRDIAQDLAKSLFLEKIHNITKDKDPSVPGTAGTSQKEQNEKLLFKKHNKKSTSDIFDFLHKYNDERLFKISDDEDDESSFSSKKQNIKSALKLLDKVDPDKLSHDMLDDLLNSYIKPKIDSSINSILKKTKGSPQKESAKSDVNLDDPEIIAQKFEALPTKIFLQLTKKKLETLNLTDSDEIQMLLQIISQSQKVVCNKLPPHLLAAVKAKMSGNNPITTEGKVQSAATSLSFSVATPPMQTPTPNVSLNATIPSASSQVLSTANYTLPLLPSAMWTSVPQGVPVPPIPPPFANSSILQGFPVPPVPPPFVNSSIKNFPVPPVTSNSNFAISNIPGFNAFTHAAMSAPGKFPVSAGAPLNSTANVATHSRMPGNTSSYNQMLSMYKDKPGVPSVTTNTGVRQQTQHACLPSAVSQKNVFFSNDMQATLESLQKMSDDYVSKKVFEAKKESETEFKKESKSLTKDLKKDSKEDNRNDFKDDSRKDSRDNYRKDSQGNSRRDSREDSKRDSREDSRRDSREDSRRESREDSRRDSREDSRRDSREDSRRDSREDSRRDSREDSRRDSRQVYRW